MRRSPVALAGPAAPPTPGWADGGSSVPAQPAPDSYNDQTAASGRSRNPDNPHGCPSPALHGPAATLGGHCDGPWEVYYTIF